MEIYPFWKAEACNQWYREGLGNMTGPQVDSPILKNADGSDYIDKSVNNTRNVQPGDRIKVFGLYVTDNDHTMYYTEPSCADDFASWRGAYMV